MPHSPSKESITVVDISLCICTCDRPDSLRRALESVYAGSAVPAEVIVSDDSGDPTPTREVVAGFPQVRYVSGPRQGVGANRNHCTRLVQRRTVTFMDDDAQVPQHYFATVEAVQRTASADTVVTGRTVNHYPNGDTVRQSPGSSDFLGFVTRPWDEGHGNMIEMNATIFPTSLFERAAFDTKLKYGYEEIDISRQAAVLGLRVAFDPRLYVDHFPSGDQSDYHSFSDAARLYSTFKHYARRRHQYVRAALFAVVAPVHHVAASIRHRADGSSPLGALTDVAIAARLCLSR